MGRPFRASVPQRSLHLLRYRLALVFLVFVVIEQHHLFFTYREALAAKHSPTNFPVFLVQHPKTLDAESSHYQDRLVANRAAWRPLRQGWEGRTFIYQDSVIKTFTPGRSPFRNCVPGETDQMWPTEISASLFFGGSEHNTSSYHDGFLPVRAFFMAASSGNQAEWHLVTPLIKGGSLQDLAAEVRKQRRTYSEVDAQYRPAFTGLLNSLQILHEAGYCHDDIKPGNILVKDDAHWILGDLGNLRHKSHPYHTSLLWKENRQLPGCQENDVLRSLRTYARFVRDAAADADVFNSDFFERQQPLSRLFWAATADVAHLGAVELRARSTAVEYSYDDDFTPFDDGATTPVPSYTWLSVLSRRWGQHHAVNQVLQTRFGEKLARWWALTWIFGTPVTTVCGV